MERSGSANLPAQTGRALTFFALSYLQNIPSYLPKILGNTQSITCVF
jgi:hypothetical protein